MPPTRTAVRRRPEPRAAVIQAKAEGVAEPADRRVELKGKWFRVADDLSLMPLMEFTSAASQGMTTGDMAAMIALRDMIRDALILKPCDCDAEADEAEHAAECAYDPGDWDDFRRHATRRKANEDDLLGVVKRVIELGTARPTSPAPGSSSPSPGISPTSTASSSPGPEGD
jgi:hypothetical protein